MKRLIQIGVVIALIVSSGCATIYSRTPKPEYYTAADQLIIYPATRMNISFFLTPFSQYDFSWVGPVFTPLVILDLPFSLVGDTILFPYDLYRWTNSDSSVLLPNSETYSPPKEATAEFEKILISAAPMPPQSIGLFLEIEPRKGPYGAPFTVLCNVNLNTLHNTSIRVWRFHKTVFYAEQDGDFFALRRIETHGISNPYCLTGMSVTLPRPPRPGRWRIFAIQEHSTKVYARHLESHGAKRPLVFAFDQNFACDGMWTKPLVSNSIFVDFAQLDEGQMRSAEGTIQMFIDAKQYDPDFRKSRDDPTRQIQRTR